MKLCFKLQMALAALVLFAFAGIQGAQDAQAQFTGQWLDVGEYHHIYAESGARKEGAPGIAEGMEYPAIMRQSSHHWAKAFWIGTKNWTDPKGQTWPTYVARIGPRVPGVDVTFPIQNKLIAKYEDTTVEVDGAIAFDNVAIVDEIDPSIPADRMIHNIHNMHPGITINRKMYAFTNEFHDNYHFITYEYCNTGNTDDDEEIELQGQNLEDVYFFRVHRWRGSALGAWNGSAAQTWGKFSMVDVVGDGHADYPLDFTLQTLWMGFDPAVSNPSNIGASLWTDSHWTVAEGDSLGRLSDHTRLGRMVLHADNSTTDGTYRRCVASVTGTDCQPRTMGFMDQDEPLTADGASHEDYYELGIRTRENPDRFAGGSQQNWPHYADRIEPSGNFWTPVNDASSGKQGGHAATTGYGPYDMAFGECINVAVAEGINGLSMDAAVQIGRAFKRSKSESALIEYDANGDGTIDTRPFNYGQPFSSGERLTKNQWYFTAQDSMFKMMLMAREAWNASNEMSQYPVPEAPRAPSNFGVFGRPDKIDITWTPAGGGPGIDHWEIYRTSRFEDNIYPNGPTRAGIDTCPYPTDWGKNGRCLGYELLASVPAGTTSFEDKTAVRGVDYYYYIQGVTGPQPVDPMGINGTPGGQPLRSSRYLTQTYAPTNLKRPAYGASGTVADARIVPNPVNLGANQNIRFPQEDRVAFFNIPGECTIKVYTEIGELVKVIEHTDGSGDELWNLTTDSRQLLVSGIYIAVIEDLAQGDTAFLKFAVIR